MQTIKGDQKLAQLKGKKVEVLANGEVQALEEANPRKSSIKEGELIEIGNGKMTQVASELELRVKESLIACLKRNMDIFAKDNHALTGITSSIAEHRLNINKRARLVKQRK